MNITPPPLRFSSLPRLTAAARPLTKLPLALAGVAGALMLTACGGDRASALLNSPGATMGSAPVEALESAGSDLNFNDANFFTGSSGGMWSRWDGTNSMKYDAVSITVTHTFTGSELTGMGVANASVTLGSDDIVATISLPSSSFQGRSFRKEEAAGDLFVDAYTDITGSTDSDYMTGGIWLYLPDSNDRLDMEFGSFAYAKSLANKSSVAGLSGSASFLGETTGVFSGKNEGTFEVGYFAGQISLTVDFADSDVTGAISDIASYWYDGDGYARTASFPVQFTLTASFGSGLSSYEGTGFLEGSIDDNSPEYMTESGSEWNAAFTGTTVSFSNVSDISGILGTYEGKITKTMDAANNWWNFVGAFGAYRKPAGTSNN